MLYPEICLPGLFPSYRPILSLLGALFLCFLNEKICQRLLAPRVCSFLAVFTLNQLYFLWSLSYFPFTVWDTSNQPLLGWLLQVHTDFFFSFIISTPELFLICAEFEKKKKKGKGLQKTNYIYTHAYLFVWYPYPLPCHEPSMCIHANPSTAYQMSLILWSLPHHLDYQRWQVL